MYRNFHYLESDVFLRVFEYEFGLIQILPEQDSKFHELD